MTRMELVRHLLHQARANGFELRRWFKTDAAILWPGGDGALEWLCQGTRMHHLLLSHSFAQAFFGGPERLRQVQPATKFERTAPNGVTRTIYRRAHPRSARYDEVWRYHLQRMAATPDPLRYAQRFLVSAEMLKRNPPVINSSITPPPRPEPQYDDELLVREDSPGS